MDTTQETKPEPKPKTLAEQIDDAKRDYQYAVRDRDEREIDKTSSALNQLLMPAPGRKGIGYIERMLLLKELRETAHAVDAPPPVLFGDSFAALLADSDKELPQIPPEFIEGKPALAPYMADKPLAAAVRQYRKDYADVDESQRQQRRNAMENRLKRLGAGELSAAALIEKIDTDCRPKSMQRVK